MSKAGLVQRAEATDFGATAAERVQGGMVGILYVDASDDQLKYIDTDGAILVAGAGGDPVTFA